jgi:hypothetical protein
MKWITTIDQPTVTISCSYGTYTLMKGEVIEHKEIAEMYPNIFKVMKEVSQFEYEAPKIINSIGEEKIELLPVPKINSADYGVYEDFGMDYGVFVLASPDCGEDDEEEVIVEEPKRKRGRPWGTTGKYKDKPASQKEKKRKK